MKVMSLFTGVGGFELGLPPEWEVVGHAEVDKYCCRVLAHNFPNTPNYGDVTKLDKSDLPDFDILIGGSPCQDFSNIGARAGLEGRNGSLFHHYVETLKESQPTYFIYENVEGTFTSNKGWDFAAMQIALVEAGYELQWQILNAKHFGVPQNRKRVFVVGNLRGESRPKVFLDTSRVEKDYESAQIQTAHCVDRNYYKGIDNHGQRTAIGIKPKTVMLLPEEERPKGNYLPRERVLSTEAIARAVTCHQSQQPWYYDPRFAAIGFVDSRGTTARENLTKPWANTVTTMGHNSVLLPLENTVRKLTPLECERLMGWPDNWTRWGIHEKDGKVVEMSDSRRYMMIGNGVVSPVVRELIQGLSEK